MDATAKDLDQDRKIAEQARSISDLSARVARLEAKANTPPPKSVFEEFFGRLWRR